MFRLFSVFSTKQYKFYSKIYAVNVQLETNELGPLLCNQALSNVSVPRFKSCLRPGYFLLQ